MYRISELAKLVGLSRSTLLYYEKVGVVSGQRAENGYRFYTDKEVQKVKLLQQLQHGGLTLKECKACLEGEVNRVMLKQRLQTLDDEITQKVHSREVLAAMLGEGDQRAWHAKASQVAPEAHIDWLITQGFSEKEAFRLKWLSKNMTEHERYMQDFMLVFKTLERWGPGSDSEVRKALSYVPHTPENILEIGCGKGLFTQLMAKETQANITATDNEQMALDQLGSALQAEQPEHSVTLLCASMIDLPFAPASFDLIWAESCAYIMGVEKALANWKPLLTKNGVLMLSDAVWLTQAPSDKAKTFWEKEYPDMQHRDRRVQQIQASGYTVIEHFTLSQLAWENYYQPLKHRVQQLRPDMPNALALQDILKEIDVFEQCVGEFGYEVFLLAAN